ncbi:RNA polymerase sigma factor [Pedobacter sp.]|uniref:RNA polymerase sigma factor n=1 Tax=Pedobacter sp. TaxID=1411316 RepID=UPI003BA853DD
MHLDAANQTSEEKLLIARIASGEERAFNVLFESYRRKVYYVALRITRSETLAEEILHDVFLKIWLHPGLTEIQDIGRYLQVSTRNITLNVLRSQRKEIQLDDLKANAYEKQHNETEETILFNDTSAVFQQAIGQLTPQQKTIYTLCKEEGLKYEEAAHKLSLSPLTVKTHMQHALRHIRAYILKHQDVSMTLVMIEILSHKK